MANENPALSENDDLANANRVAEAVSVTLVLADVDVFIDTFSDLDRGYFPRTGLVDRRYNPRMASFVFSHLHSAIGPFYGELSPGDACRITGGKICLLKRPDELSALVLPEKDLTTTSLLTDWENADTSGTGKLIDLVTGEITSFDWRKSGSEGRAQFKINPALTCSVPTLLVFSG